ncbi:hypothetical protein ACEE94_10575 [Staphylococcus epidermidis]
MIKLLKFIAFIAVLLIVLTGCGKTSKDKLQGTWKAENSFAIDAIGEQMTIKDNNVKVKGAEGTPIKYFNFKDKNDKESKYIRFYTEKSTSEFYDAENPHKEGVLHFKDNNTIEIDTSLDGTYIFKKE